MYIKENSNTKVVQLFSNFSLFSLYLITFASVLILKRKTLFLIRKAKMFGKVLVNLLTSLQLGLYPNFLVLQFFIQICLLLFVGNKPNQ